jgi:hypothetical protein
MDESRVFGFSGTSCRTRQAKKELLIFSVLSTTYLSQSRRPLHTSIDGLE